MRTPALILCLALSLGGCAVLKKHEAPVCDGKHGRPANPHGSILDGAASPVPPPQPDQLSAAPLFFASCA